MTGPRCRSADAAAGAGAGRPGGVGLALAVVAGRGRGRALAVAVVVAAGRGGGRTGAEGERRDGGDGGADQTTGAELKHGVTSGAGGGGPRPEGDGLWSASATGRPHLIEHPSRRGGSAQAAART